MDPQDDGQQHRARIVELITQHEDKVTSNPSLIKFKCSLNNDEYEEILSYNDIVDYINRKENN